MVNEVALEQAIRFLSLAEVARIAVARLEVECPILAEPCEDMAQYETEYTGQSERPTVRAA